MPPGRDPFPVNVIKKVHAISGGIPRLINILCDRMLLGAYTQEATQIDGTICKQATEEVLGDPREKALRRSPISLASPLIYGVSAVLVSVVLSALIWMLVSRTPAPGIPSPLPVQNTLVDVKPPVVEPLNYWVRNQDAALSELLGHLGVKEETAVYPCWLASKKELHCETLEAKTWTDFLAINRPAVLTVNTPTRHAAYVTLVGVEGNEAEVLFEGKKQQVSLDELGTQWTGEYVIIWRRPAEFEQPVGLGASGPLVDWLAGQFATLDAQKTPLTNNTFNKMLERRVKLFQRSYALQDDGLVGLQTFLRLNEALGVEIPLQPMAGAVAPPIQSAMEN